METRSWGPQISGPNGQPPDALARGRENGIAESRGDGRHARLAAATGRIRAGTM